MSDGQIVFLFCVVYSGALSLVIFANMVAREWREAPLPPQQERPLPMDRERRLALEYKDFKKEA